MRQRFSPDSGDRAPELEIDGEMHADAALIEAIRNRAAALDKLACRVPPTC